MMTITTNFLKTLALIVICGIFLKAVIDVDGTWDTWMYHLPWAARVWGISTPSDYVMHSILENRYEGFPLLTEYLQGLFWLLTQRPESANLVSFFSLALYILFLKRYLNIPFYLSTITLLAIPLVQIHTVFCYIDLPANFAVSILVIMCYLLYTRENFVNRQNLLIMVLAAACAVNMRFVLTPLVFITISLILLRLAILGWQLKKQGKFRFQRLLLVSTAMGLALLIIFATPIKNVIVHGNPAYPVMVTVAGVALNYKEVPTEPAPTYLEHAPRLQRWLYSIMDVGTYPFTHPLHWSVDQFVPHDFGNRLGGYFAVYVIFNLLLLVYLTFKIQLTESKVIFYLMLCLTVLTAMMPQSHELRYYLYWMILLVSLNTYLVLQIPPTLKDYKFINPTTLGIVAALAMITVIAVTRAMYVRPAFYTFNDLHKQRAHSQVIQTLHAEKGKICFYRMPWTFLYSAVFNPPMEYAIKEGENLTECGDYKFKPEWVIFGGGS